MKRILYVLSGIISFTLIIIASASPVSASTYGAFFPNTWKFVQNCNGTNTSQSVNFDGNSDLAAFESTGVCGLSQLSFSGGGLSSLAPIVNESYFNIYFSLYIQPVGNDYFPTFLPNFAGLGSQSAGSKSFANSVIDSSVDTHGDFSLKYLQYDVTIHGTLGFAAGSSPDTLGFDGRWLMNTSGQKFRVVMSRPKINVYGNYDAMMNDKLGGIKTDTAKIVELLQGGSLNSGVISAINNQTETQHQDAQAQLEESQKQTQAMEDTKDYITSDERPEASDIANSDSLPSVGLLPAGPLDSLLLLPVNILNSIVSSFGGNCSPVVAPIPFVGDGEEVTFPCFGDTIYKGSFSVLATLFGSVASGFILYSYFKHLYKKVDRAVSLETTDEDEWGIL